MRTITTHQVNSANDKLVITVLDEPGEGGASHVYQVAGFNTDSRGDAVAGGSDQLVLPFQRGPIKEAGVNGVTQEVLLAIVIDRLEGFQRGKFANEYNAAALHHLRGAADCLLQRTRQRIGKGIEGTHQVDVEDVVPPVKRDEDDGRGEPRPKPEAGDGTDAAAKA